MIGGKESEEDRITIKNPKIDCIYSSKSNIYYIDSNSTLIIKHLFFHLTQNKMMERCMVVGKNKKKISKNLKIKPKIKLKTVKIKMLLWDKQILISKRNLFQ